MNVVEGITKKSNSISFSFSDCNPSQTTEKETMSSQVTSSKNASNNKTAATPATEEDVMALEQRLKSAMEDRQAKEESIKREQNELHRLLSKPIKKPSLPTSMTELERQIAALELERTVQSMSLAEEHAILKRIHKLRTLHQKSLDFEVHDQLIKQRKSAIQTMRSELQQQKTAIAALETELKNVQTAMELGCAVSALVRTIIRCPSDKLGKVIGKNGQSLLQLQKHANVTMDIVRSRSRSGSRDESIDEYHADHHAENRNNHTGMGVICLQGTHDSIESAKANLDRVFQETELQVELPAETHYYLADKGIVYSAQLREKHPRVHWQLHRLTNSHNYDSSSGANKSDRSKYTVSMRGVPGDIEKLRQDLLENLPLTTETLTLSTRESGLIVGKGGVTIAAMVEKHQTAIQVKKDTTADATTSEPATATVTLIGLANNVAETRADLVALLSEHRDVEEIVTMNDAVNTRGVLLLQNGAGIQALQKRVNETTRASTTKMVDGNNSNVVVSLKDQGISIKGRRHAIDKACPIVEAEIQRIEQLTTTIAVDPIVIPVMIGKGGQNIKALKGDTKCVNIEFDRTAGQVLVCGLKRDEVEAVVANVEAVKADHELERICFETSGSTNNINNKNTFVAQIKSFLRSPVSKQVRDLVFMLSDDTAGEIVLRGKAEPVQEAATLVREYLRQNYMEELSITSEDLTALLTGAKQSKIVQFSQQTGARLSVDRDQSLPVVVARGERDNVRAALNAIREFVYGSTDVEVRKVVLDNHDLMGFVIGKGGKHKVELQERFAKTSIIFHRSEAAVTLRGPSAEVQECHVELLKLVHGARVVRTMELTDEQVQDIEQSKFYRSVTQTLPVHVMLTPEKKEITFRGTLLDVQEAQALLKEQLDGVRESRLPLGVGSIFQKVQAACKDGSYFSRIEKQSCAKVELDQKTHEIVVLGQKETVPIAKEAIFQFLQFLMGPCVGRCAVNESQQRVIVNKPGCLAEVAANSGAQHVSLDRDVNVVWMMSSDEEHVLRAREMVNAILVEGKNLMFVMQLEPSEDWIVSSIIGKNGVSIKKLRRQTDCMIEVDSHERRIVVTAEDPDKVAQAETVLKGLVEKKRSECLFFTIPDKDMPAFVGRSGAHLRQFEAEHGVDVQVLKNRNAVVRITGDADKVAASNVAIEAWLASREESRKEADGAVLTKRLHRSQIPVVIGPKGATIRNLQKEFECRVDIDRKQLTVTVRGGTEEKRLALLEKIYQIIGQAETDGEEGGEGAASPESGFSDDKAGVVSDEPSNARNEMAKKTEKSRGPTTELKSKASESSPTIAASLTGEMGDFPELIPGGKSCVSQAKGSWSSGEITFIGDVVEKMMDDVMELMD